jgi:ribosomal protein S18 acetylase RimI-like enzyme
MLPGVPAMNPQLRRATGSDVKFLADVVLLANEDRYRSRPDWDREAFHAGLVEDAADQVAGELENSVTYVIVTGRIDVGRARLVTVPDRIEIAGLQILPDHQNRGIGTAVISQVIDQATAAGLPVVLDVETDNPDARRLYERLSFHPIGPVTKGRQKMIFRTGSALATQGPEAKRVIAEQWARNNLNRLGRRAAGPMTTVSVQGWSTVWRIPSGAGDIMVKQTTAARRREGKIITFCAEAAPDQVDAPLAIDPVDGRMVLVDRARPCMPRVPNPWTELGHCAGPNPETGSVAAVVTKTANALTKKRTILAKSANAFAEMVAVRVIREQRRDVAPAPIFTGDQAPRRGLRLVTDYAASTSHRGA